MTTKMTHARRMELANAMRDRYAAASNKDKHRILEEFVAAIGYHAKSAIRILNSVAEPMQQLIGAIDYMEPHTVPDAACHKRVTS